MSFSYPVSSILFHFLLDLCWDNVAYLDYKRVTIHKCRSRNTFTETLLSDVFVYLFDKLAHGENITVEQKDMIRNLYLSGIGEEFIAMQLDVEIPDVIKVLKEIGVYKSPD